MDEAGWSKAECSRQSGLAPRSITSLIEDSGVSRNTCVKFLNALSKNGGVERASFDLIEAHTK